MPRNAPPPAGSTSRPASPAREDDAGGRLGVSSGSSSRRSGRDDPYGDLEAPPLSDSRRQPRSLRGDGHTASGRRRSSRASSSPAGGRNDRDERSRSPSPGGRGSPPRTRWSPERQTPRAEIARGQSLGSLVRTAAMTDTARRKFGNLAGVDVPNEAFLRVNILDVLTYQEKERLVTLKLYIDVTWRSRGMAELEAARRKKTGEKGTLKWSNSDEKRENDLPEKIWKQAPLEFKARHNVSDFVDHIIKSEGSDWNDWYALDEHSEARFNTMGQELDPGGAGKFTRNLTLLVSMGLFLTQGF